MISGMAPQFLANTGVPHAIASITAHPHVPSTSIVTTEHAGIIRRDASHRLVYRQSERLRPVYGKDQAGRITQESRLPVLRNLTDIFHAVAIDQRFDMLAEIGAIVLADLRSQLDPDARASGDFYGAVGPLVA